MAPPAMVKRNGRRLGNRSEYRAALFSTRFPVPASALSGAPGIPWQRAWAIPATTGRLDEWRRDWPVSVRSGAFLPQVGVLVGFVPVVAGTGFHKQRDMQVGGCRHALHQAVTNLVEG